MFLDIYGGHDDDDEGGENTISILDDNLLNLTTLYHLTPPNLTKTKHNGKDKGCRWNCSHVGISVGNPNEVSQCPSLYSRIKQV